jgi:hypothetical protein
MHRVREIIRVTLDAEIVSHQRITPSMIMVAGTGMVREVDKSRGWGVRAAHYAGSPHLTSLQSAGLEVVMSAQHRDNGG